MRNFLVSGASIVLIGIIGLVTYWFLKDPFSIQVEFANDYLERVFDTAIAQNARDFYLWYKANIIIQILAIIAGILATVAATLTTSTNASVIKYYTIALTSLTSLLVGVQSTFHIRENLVSFVRVNTELSNLEGDYLKERETIDPKDAAKKAELTAKYNKLYNEISEVRWRSYAIIGQSIDTKSDGTDSKMDAKADSNANNKAMQKTNGGKVP